MGALTAAAILLLLGSLILLVFLRHGPDGESTVFGHPVLEVTTGSMTPTFDPGDLIVDAPVSPSAAQHLRRGQVITFRSAQYLLNGAPILVTHRIQRVESTASGVEYQTKGDANNVADAGLVTPAEVVGLYQGWRVPAGAYVLNALHHRLTFVVLAVLLVAVLGAGEFRRRWRSIGEFAGDREGSSRGAGR